MKNTNEERVEVYLPKAYGDEEPNLFVSVGGVNYLLPRGKKSSVPPAVAHELARARSAEEAFDRRVRHLTEGGV